MPGPPPITRATGSSVLAVLGVVIGLGVGGGSGCGGDELTCVEVDLSCQPLYPPTFDQIFTNTLLPKCGTEGSTCHSPEGHKAGLVFDDVDAAYRRLVDGGRVLPGEPSCSVLIERVYARAASLRMPPGRTLADAERCALLQWVAAGAPRRPAVGPP